MSRASPPPSLDEERVVRYARHVLLPEVGGAGQVRLLESEVAIQGLGPSGAWAAAYLALAGVGKLWLDDPHPVDSLLPLLGPADLGRPRDGAFCQALASFNPDVLALVGPGSRPSLRIVTSSWATDGEAVLEVRTEGAMVQVAWVDRICSACRALPRLAGGPTGGALAGSLAAAEVVARLLDLPRRPVPLRLLDGLPVKLPDCPHGRP